MRNCKPKLDPIDRLIVTSMNIPDTDYVELVANSPDVLRQIEALRAAYGRGGRTLHQMLRDRASGEVLLKAQSCGKVMVARPEGVSLANEALAFQERAAAKNISLDIVTAVRSVRNGVAL